jgi:sugar lactone lactonase YvrE
VAQQAVLRDQVGAVTDGRTEEREEEKQVADHRRHARRQRTQPAGPTLRPRQVRAPSSPFCIDWLPDGRLLVVSGGEGFLLRREPDGSLVRHADLSGLSGHAWNEIVVDGRGNAYVNNIGFQFGGAFAPGIIALVTPDGSVRRVAEDVHFPNGMVMTPDNATLIVAESYGNTLTALATSPRRRRTRASCAGTRWSCCAANRQMSTPRGEVPRGCSRARPRTRS